MKITALETIRLEEFANLLWLRVHTDGGSGRPRRDLLSPGDRRGLCPRVARPKTARPRSAPIDRIAKDVTGYVGFRSTGAEMRGNSALDIALWDISAR